jgi:hypothetical protein
MSLHPQQHKLLLSLLSMSVLLAICFGAAGCGSGSSDQALTKKEFAARAERICERARTTVSSTAIAYKRKNPSIEEVDLVTKVATPSIEEEIRQIKALGTPSEGKSEVMAFVNGFEDGLADISKDPQVILAAKTNPFTKGKTAAAAYGLEICSTFP